MNIQTLFAKTPVTTLLLIAIISLFTIQALTGTNINAPSNASLLAWGANFFPLTFGNEPWRLITSAFLHIGFMHLLFNAFAIYFFGQVTEITFGHSKFLLLFILSAIGGNLLNGYVTLWQVIHNNVYPGISAGASGGIMGLGMALLMVEILKAPILNYPKNHDNKQLKNLALIMGINLLYGFAVPGIDNAGHIGGALTGAILAIVIMFGFRFQLHSNNVLLKNIAWLAIAVFCIAFYLLWFDLHQALTL